MAEERFPVFATRMNHKAIESRLRSARNGFGLLKAKSNALQIYYRALEERFKAIEENTNSVFQKAFMCLSRAEFYGANVEMFRKRCARRSLSIETAVSVVCGVVLPTFKIVRDEIPAVEVLQRGGAKLIEAKVAFDGLLSLLVDISSARNSFLLLKSTLDVTNRRVNALEYMLIPKLERTLYFISGELDEQERENFYKLKKIQGLNK